jgi:transposase-like protein
VFNFILLAVTLKYCSILYIFGVDRARSTVHNWVHKADLQPQDPNHVAVNETVIQLDDQQYWLYAAVDPETNDLLQTKLEPTRTNVIATHSSPNSARSTTSMTLYFSSMERHRFRKRVAATVSISHTNNMEIETALNVSFVR